jgi:ATP-dependent DNA helicase RecG
MRVFSRIGRDARRWMEAPSDEALSDIERTAREATAQVPEARRADWERLLSGFAGAEETKRRRARVEGLVRACRLFDREERERIRRAQPLDWSDAVDRADGLGPAARASLAGHGVSFVADLVWTLPVGWDDLRSPVSVAEAVARATEAQAALATPPRQCVRGQVKSASFVPMRGRRAVRVILTDGPGGATLDAWWFYVAHGALALARSGVPCLVIGRVHARDGKRPMVAHPDLVRDDETTRGIRPRYPALGVAPGTLRRAVADAVARVTSLPDPVPEAIALREGLPAIEPLIRAVHGASFDAPPADAWRALAERLAWAESFTRVWQRLLSDAQWGAARGVVIARDEGTMARFAGALGFPLTSAQKRAIDEVTLDLASPAPMRRLLLGDVGTGKTAVAFAAAAQCVAAGQQCAMLVPTGVLADQYVDAAGPLVTSSGARVQRFVAGMRAAERRSALAAIASGEANVVVGTHALLEQDVTFARLGLVVVDEQQRLGVAQRLTLVRKGEGARTRPHLLSLSATPIPRTMALALRGELATSVLDERPRGRAPVRTELCPRASTGRWLAAMRQACAEGGRVFFVCPRIEDDEEDQDAGVIAHGERLARDLSPAPVVVAHGALPRAQLQQAMRAFRRGEAQVLVGTTVVEVGIDVPEATLMVVDGADRFGLAQLHQLRGRVGRGERPAACLLLHDEPLSDIARRRLETLRSTADGMEIARADLALRGAGDLGGTRQSGAVEDFGWLDPGNPPPWIERLEGDARALLACDPSLEAPEHRALAFAVRRFAVTIAVREEAG